MFKVLREGTASVVTDHVQTFTERGSRCGELEADIVVAATGLQLQMLGGLELRIDGKVKHLGERMTYRAFCCRILLTPHT